MEATAQHVDHELEMLWQTYLSSRDKADLLQYVKRFMFYYEAHNPKEIGPFNVGIEQSTDQYQQLGFKDSSHSTEGLMESVVSELVSLELVKVKDEKVTLVYVIDLLRICKVLFRYIPAHVEAISGSSSAVGIQIIIDLIQNWFSEKIILNHSDLQEPLLLLLESVVSSFQENAVQVISPVVIEGLFDVLSYFSPGNISDGSFNVVLYCFTRVVHSLHASSLQQCQVDVPSILNRFLDLLDTRDDVCLTDDEVQFKISLLECIPVMLDCTDSPVLQAIFIGIRGLEKVIAATEKLVNDRPSALQNKLCCVCLHATMAILKHSDPAKEVFKASVGYDRLRNLLAAVKQPSCELIHTVFCMMLEGNVKTDNRLIENSAVVLFVLDWLPYLPQEQQRYLAQCLVSLCLHSPFNQMTCCEAGIISKIISFLDGKEELDAKLKLIFISLLEVFGAYSITAGELKQLLSLFQPSNQEKKVLCSNRLMQAIARMAAGSGIEKTLNYFDFHHQTAGINVPCISRWGGHGFSFHVWVCLEPLSEESSGSSLQGWRCRRQLYSFLTAHSTGFEGFFTDEGHLVIAVVTRKEFLTSVVLSTNLYDGQWHCLDIVHTGSRNPFGHSQLLAFIDGSQKLSSQLKFPNISEPFVSCHIGLPGCQTMRHRNKPQKKFSFQKLTHLADPAISSSLLSKFPPCIAVGTQNDVWGVPISLQGLLASVCVFNETMQETHVTELWQAGPNTLSVFEGADLSSDQENSNSVGSYGCSDLANKLVLYYNAKACHDSICTDLTPRSPGQPVLNGSLTGQKCKTWDIKETINCIGGIQVLLPILEQVEYDPNMSVIDTVEVDEIDADLLTASDVFIDTEVETTSDTKLLKSPSNVSLPRSVSSSSSSDMYLPVEIAQNDNGWIVVDNQVQVRRHSHRGRTNPLEDRVENNGVVAFFYLLKNMIKGSLVNQEILVKAHIIETIGAILEVKDHRFIDVNVLMSIQSLVEAVAPANRTLLNLVYRHLLFNFQIWSYSEFPVRIGHMQYLSTLIKDNPEQLRETFGVQYILNVIRIHYTTSEDLSPKVNSSRNPSVLQDNESRIIRAAHLGLIKYYLKSDARPEEVSSLVNFMAGADDENMLTDLLEMLVTVTSRSTGKLLTKLSEPQNTALLLMLVAGPYEENIKLKVLRILYKVLGSDRILRRIKAICA